MELTQAQQDIVQATQPKIVVCAAAASGKTNVIIERLLWLLSEGVNPQGIVVITFTNAAAAEIMSRLIAAYGSSAQGVFVGTIHSYANALLKGYGVDTSDILDNELFDRLFIRVKNNLGCIKPVAHLLLDEAQDSTPQEFEFLLDMVQPQNYLLIGDIRQSIYRFREADPDYLIELMRTPGVTTYHLNTNYRNDAAILRYAKGIIKLAGIDYIDYSQTASLEEGAVYNQTYDPERLITIIDSNGEWGKWFILTRTNDQLDTMREYLHAAQIPFDTFKRSNLDNDELYKRLSQNTVKLLTIHSAKGLENDYVAVIGAQFYNVEEICVSYVAATRARHRLFWLRKKAHRQTRLEKIGNWER